MSKETVSLDLCICHIFSKFVLGHEEKYFQFLYWFFLIGPSYKVTENIFSFLNLGDLLGHSLQIYVFFIIKKYRSLTNIIIQQSNFSLTRPVSNLFSFFCYLFIGLWNLASLFSNLCLFVLMPFAFFFLESEGFAGLKKVSESYFGIKFVRLRGKCHSC